MFGLSDKIYSQHIQIINAKKLLSDNSKKTQYVIDSKRTIVFDNNYVYLKRYYSTKNKYLEITFNWYGKKIGSVEYIIDEKEGELWDGKLINYASGFKDTLYTYERGSKQGLYMKYYKNGKIRRIGYCIGDLEIGEYAEYNIKGEICYNWFRYFNLATVNIYTKQCLGSYDLMKKWTRKQVQEMHPEGPWLEL
jgi:antitoxin component YwqK of YwqJK toxin-antitoxin module